MKKTVQSEKAILVGIIRPGETKEQVQDNLDELAFLALTAGADVIGNFTQKMRVPHARSFVGSGKLEEIKEFVEVKGVDLLIFDDELSPSQIKNLEKEFKKIKIIDRTNLILDIFAKRAKTAQAKAQVELAQYEYLLPRLTRMWTHLERQRGGIGLRGPGETEIETDRRIIRDKIALLKKRLDKIDKQNAIQRKSRGQKIRVALVGYTNAGKSTTMNLLSKSDVFAEDKLFATLDTTVRNMVIDRVTFLLSDTVGFIRKLPHRLVESFKSTLDEAREADILLHVIDLSHVNYEQQIKTVNQTLEELGAIDKPILHVFNKADKLPYDFIEEFEGVDKLTERIKKLETSYIAKENNPAVFISAKKKINIDKFRKTILKMVVDSYKVVYPNVPVTIEG
jgi:GTP-binding protein HflX